MTDEVAINFTISFEPNFWNEENLRGWEVPFTLSTDEIEQLRSAIFAIEIDSEMDNGFGIRSTNKQVRDAYPALFKRCDEMARNAIIDICGEICPNPLPEIYWYVDVADIIPENPSPEDELETVITGEGNVRHLKYYVGDRLFVQHWLIRNGSLSILYSYADIEGGYTNKYTDIPVTPLLQHFNCLETELINQIMSHCKRLEDEICLDIFLQLLKQLNISYDVQTIEEYDVDWSSGEPKVVPLK